MELHGRSATNNWQVEKIFEHFRVLKYQRRAMNTFGRFVAPKCLNFTRTALNESIRLHPCAGMKFKDF